MSAALVIAEPEDWMRGYLQRHLPDDGFEVVAAAADPAELLRTTRPDLVLLGDLAALDRWRPHAPVIVLGEPEADVRDRVQAFRRGCDDYVDRRIAYEELVERIRAVLRRTAPEEVVRIEAGPVVIDLPTRRVTIAGTRVTLAQKEYELLIALARDPDRVFTKEELLRDVWDFRSPTRLTRTLDSHASRLRRKLTAADPERRYVVNVWGVGYVLLGEAR
jgi:DNA-binding response OmpR family regulator